MARKGNAYQPVAVVAQAVTKLRWPPERFFVCAGQFQSARGYDPKAAEEIYQGVSPGKFPGVVIAFANWVLTADPIKIAKRFPAHR